MLWQKDNLLRHFGQAERPGDYGCECQEVDKLIDFRRERKGFVQRSLNEKEMSCGERESA
jgi:hypothetical protein